MLRAPLLWFTIGILVARQSGAATMEPLPFTGYLQYEGQSSVIPVRITLISRYERLPEDNSIVSTSSAIVTIFLGEFDGPESIPLYYDRADYNRNTNLFRLETSAAYHPRITFTWDFEAPEIQGEVLATSQEDGRFVKGHLRLKRGWEPTAELPFPGTLIRPVAGIYSGYCPSAVGSSNVSLRHLQIFSSRFGGAQRPNDTTMTAITYVGNLQCIRGADVRSQHVCGAHDGVINLASNTLSVGSGSLGIFQCSRDSVSGDLTCNSERFRQCRLTRKDLPVLGPSGLSMPTWPKPSLVKPPEDRPSPGPPMEWQEFERLCSLWDGTYGAILTHASSGRQQLISLNFVHYVSDDPRGRRCNISGGVNLSIGRRVASEERLFYPIPSTDVDVTKPSVAIRTQGESDRLIVQLNREDNGELHGFVYSTSWGYVGEISATKDPDLIRLGDAMTNPIHGLVSNRWQDEFDPTLNIFISVAQRSPDRGVNSPYAQLLIQGWLEQVMSTPDGSINFRENIISISYDLFANQFTIRSDGIFLTGAFVGEKIHSLIALRKNGAIAKEPGRIHRYVNKS